MSLLDLPAVLVDMGVYRTAHAAISRNNRQNMDHLADLDLVALEDIDPSGGNLCMTQEMQTDTRLLYHGFFHNSHRLCGGCLPLLYEH